MPCDLVFPFGDDLQAVLFDLDGTLVRTFIDFPRMRADMHAMSARWGTEAATQSESDVLEIVAKMADALGEPAGGAARQEAYARLEAIEWEGCQRAEPVEGASGLLHHLRNERVLPVAVITRNCRRVARDLIRRFRLSPGRDEDLLLVAREDTLRFKPHPDPVLHACRAHHVCPERTVLVGDLWTDIAAGKAAGARTIGIQWPHDPPNRFARCPPDVEVASLREAAALLLRG